MPATALATFMADALQCDNLIAAAHHSDPAGTFTFSKIDREQITQAAFLNLFIAWERFLEDMFAKMMTGQPTVNGTHPVKYVAPPNIAAANAMVIGTQKYFDYANVELVRRMAALYFQGGYPFEPHMGASVSDIADMRTMRNAAAHISSTTQRSLESLAQRLLGKPQPGISLYTLLTTLDPASATGETVFGTYRDKLKVAAQLIATG